MANPAEPLKLAVAEWYSLFRHTRHSQASRDKYLNFLVSTRLNESEKIDDGMLLEALLSSLWTEKDELFRINLLIFLQENLAYFLRDGQRLERVYSILNTLLATPTVVPAEGETVHGSTVALKSQILVTLTNAMIEIDAIHTRQKSLETFVELLFDNISRINESPERCLRATACECLSELERAFPCLLVPYIGHLLTFCQNENTHAAQSYLTLLLLVVQHAVAHVAAVPKHTRDPPDQSAAATPNGPVVLPPPQVDIHAPFVVPTVARSIPAGAFLFFSDVPANSVAGRLSDTVAREVVKSLSFVNSNLTLLTPSALLHVVLHLLPFTKIASVVPAGAASAPAGMAALASEKFLSKDLFMHNFLGCLYSYHSVLVHIALLLRLRFGAEQFDPSMDALVVDRLLALAADVGLPVATRLLAVRWLAEMPPLVGAVGAPPPAGAVVTKYRKLYPTIFDPLSLRSEKLQTLLLVAASPLPPMTPPPSGGLPTPAALLKAVTCLEEFRAGPPRSPSAAAAFAFLGSMLRRFPPIQSSEGFDAVHAYLVALLDEHPRFSENVIALVDGLAKLSVSAGGGVDLSHKLMSAFHASIVAMATEDVATNPAATANASRLAHFLPLIERIARDQRLDAVGLVNALHRYVRFTDVCIVPGHWRQGSQLLAILASMMRSHPTARLVHPLGALLYYISQNFSDIEIRDRALFYHRLLTHVPGDTLRTILSPALLEEASDVADEPVTPGGSRLLDMAIRDLPTILSLTRDTEPACSGDAAIGRGVSTAPWKCEVGPDSSTWPAAYAASLQRRITDGVAYIELPFILRYLAKADTFEGVPEKLFAIMIDIEPPRAPVESGSSMPLYAPLSIIRIPYLAKVPRQSSTGDVIDPSRFPYVHRLSLQFRPIVPTPASFRVAVAANDAAGTACRTRIEPISVQFTDLFVPPPTVEPLQASTGSAAQRSEFLKVVFDSLWKQIKSEVAARDSATATNNSGGAVAAVGPEMSVKVVPLGGNRMMSLVQRKLAPFVVAPASPAPNKQDTQLLCAMACLPPRYHLLFKFIAGPDKTVVRVATDYWRALAYLDAFFEEEFLAK